MEVPNMEVGEMSRPASVSIDEFKLYLEESGNIKVEFRRCLLCKNLLSRYNPDDLCFSHPRKPRTDKWQPPLTEHFALPKTVIAATLQVSGYDPGDILSQTAKKFETIRKVRTRQILMFLLRYDSRITYRQVMNYLETGSYSRVYEACKLVEREKNLPYIQKQISAIRSLYKKMTLN